MSRIFLFDITREQLLFWDQEVPIAPTWDSVKDMVPTSWHPTDMIVCHVAKEPELPIYMLCGNDVVRGFYNRDNLLTGFEIGTGFKKRWHVNDFTMLPDPVKDPERRYYTNRFN